MKIHRFLTRAKELFLGNLDNLERCLSRISLGRSGSLQKGFIKLSSQFIFSRDCFVHERSVDRLIPITGFLSVDYMPLMPLL